MVIDGHDIAEVPAVKYLGVTLDNRMSWKPHIDNVIGKFSRGCWAIANLRKFLNMEILRTLYYSLVYPYIHYGITNWGSAAKTHLSKLEIKHKQIVRLMTWSKYNSPSNPIFVKLRLLKIQDVFKLKIAMLIKKIITDDTLVTNGIQLLSEIHPYSTRSKTKHKFYVPRTRTNLGKTTIQYQGPIIWNEIPDEYREKNFTSLKRSLKKYYIEKYKE